MDRNRKRTKTTLQMIQLTQLNDKRILLNIKDIRAVIETDSGTKIVFYSDARLIEYVKEDFEDIRKTIIQ